MSSKLSLIGVSGAGGGVAGASSFVAAGAIGGVACDIAGSFVGCSVAGSVEKEQTRASRDSDLRSQGSSGEEQPFALCARDGLDRFQCSLRSESRSAGGMMVSARREALARNSPSRLARGMG